MNDIDKLINSAYESALQGEILDRESIIALLNIDPNSKGAEKLGEAARDVAAQVTGNQGRIWASIGVDYQVCSMNCDFCSFGEKWGFIKGGGEWIIDDVVNFTQKFVSHGAKWVTLRTTQFYGLERLTELAKKVRAAVLGDYCLVANTGEFNKKNADLMLKSGIDVVYHTLRLREGINTRFQRQERLDTLEAIKASQLTLAYLIEPVGVEHNNEEIADVFLTGMKYGAKLSGAMARVPVPDTPLGNLPAISERRLAQLVAVTRLAAGSNAPDICVHPPSQLAMEWGANVVVVETGAIPRDNENCCSEWQGFDIETAKEWFKKAGYQTS